MYEPSWVVQRGDEGVGSLRISGSWESQQCWGWGLNLGPLVDQKVPQVTEPSRQSVPYSPFGSSCKVPIHCKVTLLYFLVPPYACLPHSPYLPSLFVPHHSSVPLLHVTAPEGQFLS